MMTVMSSSSENKKRTAQRELVGNKKPKVKNLLDLRVVSLWRVASFSSMERNVES